MFRATIQNVVQGLRERASSFLEILPSARKAAEVPLVCLARVNKEGIWGSNGQRISIVDMLDSAKRQMEIGDGRGK